MWTNVSERVAVFDAVYSVSNYATACRGNEFICTL